MLLRILTDNPGPTFTRNFDATFVKTVKELLREGQDLSVQQILRETLDSFATGKTENETLGPLMEMWKREKAKSNTRAYGNSVSSPSRANPQLSANMNNRLARVSLTDLLKSHNREITLLVNIGSLDHYHPPMSLPLGLKKLKQQLSSYRRPCSQRLVRKYQTMILSKNSLIARRLPVAVFKVTFTARIPLLMKIPSSR